MREATLSPVTEPRLSYVGPGRDGYTGVYMLPGDTHWRPCRDTGGEVVFHSTPAEAEADAAHRLVAGFRQS